MSTKFFTNEEENTLLTKLEGVFHHRNIYYFDALVGFFRASGYFRIRKFIGKVSKIRILVGINIDRLVFEAHEKGLEFGQDEKQTRDGFLERLREDIQDAEYRKDIEDGMIQFITDLSDKKIEIKVHPSKNIHAKVYIFREEKEHEHGYGAVITGSSNLTDAGLARNFEFNVELRDNEDIKFAKDTFDKLWNEAKPISPDFISEMKKDTYLNDQFSPFEINMKFLIEYFGSNVNYDPNSVSDLPSGYQKLKYQGDAVSDGFNKMMKHNGFFLADVVGLGKTVVALQIAKKFYYANGFPNHRSKILIITPPAIEDNWEKTARDFGLSDAVTTITNGSLHKIRYPEDFDLVIVDEAHKFRTDTADMYRELQNICKTNRKKIGPLEEAPKKVILVSATPLNNKPEDIANLIYLFQDAKDSTLEIANLRHFFSALIDRYKDLKHEQDVKFVQNEVKKIYDEIRTKVLQSIIVRRTRTDLRNSEDYLKDIHDQKIVFPAVKKPEPIYYQLDSILDELYDRTITALKDPQKGLKYYRYQAIAFLKSEKKQKYQSADLISRQLAVIMKTLLVKRIDSSFFAFKQSLKRFADANKAMLKMVANDRIYIAPDLKVSEYILSDREDELIELINKESESDPRIETCAANDFEDDFIQGLQHDQQILSELIPKWDQVIQDPKLDEFVHRLQTELFDTGRNQDGKLVVFSESLETTNYLREELAKRINKRVICVDSQNRRETMPMIQANFDANIPIKEQRNDFDIVISTEVLAEGVNLHRSNIIVNYDTPWNATRLMQRIGRVNRIGSTAAHIHIYNFYPTAKVDSDIELKKKALMKLQAFHSALGEDSQIYSTEEEFESFGLFDKNVEEDADEQLGYLMKLRKFKAENPEQFKNIKNMPLRARVGRKNQELKHSTISFIRNKRRDAFYLIHPEGQIEPVSFIQAANYFQATSEEKAVSLHDRHHEHIGAALHSFREEMHLEKAKYHAVDVTLGPNEKRALMFLDAMSKLDIAGKEEQALIGQAKEAIRLGKFQNLHRDLNKLQKSSKTVKHVFVLEKLMHILNSFPLTTDFEVKPSHEVVMETAMPEIIISESFS